MWKALRPAAERQLTRRCDCPRLQGMRYWIVLTLGCLAGGFCWHLRSVDADALATPNSVAARPTDSSADGSAPGRHEQPRHYQPHNIAIVVESTTHMNNTDSACHARSVECELGGIRSLLLHLAPCMSRTEACGESSDSGNASEEGADRVGLFTFPGVTVDTVANEYNCEGQYPVTVPHTFPLPNASDLITPPITVTRFVQHPIRARATYQIAPFTNDYRVSNAAQELNSKSDLVKALGGAPGCAGIKALGGFGSYSVPAIYAAEISLAAERAARPGSKNILIVIWDGENDATKYSFAPGATDLGQYPSWVNECGQALEAAKAAKAAGTTLYTVAYYATTHNGCLSDESGPAKGIPGCDLMRSMASSPSTFFADSPIDASEKPDYYPVPCTTSPNHMGSLDSIFARIARSIRTKRERSS